jgi:hypothetical protein
MAFWKFFKVFFCDDFLIETLRILLQSETWGFQRKFPKGDGKLICELITEVRKFEGILRKFLKDFAESLNWFRKGISGGGVRKLSRKYSFLRVFITLQKVCW